MIEVSTVTVYRSPTAGRRFLTARAACAAEARALIKRKYPSEQQEYEDGHMTYPGFHWVTLPNSEKLLRRMTRLVRASMAAALSQRVEGGT